MKVTGKPVSLLEMACIVFALCVATAITLPAQTLTTLYSFGGPDGANPVAPLVKASDGNFYGTTGNGGSSTNCFDGCGTIFKITPSGTLTTLYSFCSQPNCADGAEPVAGLIQATDGNFYGTALYGGKPTCLLGGGTGCGTVFKITPAGVLTTLHGFDYTEGANPSATLVQGSDGNFYGTAQYGGDVDYGTVFKITAGGMLTLLHSFHDADGAQPYAGLVQAVDGNLYGTTKSGSGIGSVFKMTPAGMLTNLHTFNEPDGATVVAGLVQATDGNLYGTAVDGGANDYGTVFKITLTGTLTTLYSFSKFIDGAYPQAALTEGPDGDFYGTTYGGVGSDCWGLQGCGTIFKITPSGTLTMLYQFCSQTNCADGDQPEAGLVLGADGNFYGTTPRGGAYGAGTVFRLSGPPPSPVQFVPVAPCRLLDTRPDKGGNGPIQGRTSQAFNLPQLAQVNGCADLSSAVAYSLNVAVVPQGPLGYLTLWPAGKGQPFVATLNSLDGRIKANAAIMQAGVQGFVSMYVTDTTNVVIDINGYFAPASGSTLAFYPLPPCRVADTRHSTYPPGLGPPYLTGGQERAFPILSATICNIPSSAAAYSLNFSVVPHGPLGYMTVWPTGENRPVVSTLNDIPGQIIANAAIVVAGTGGDVSGLPL